ncbi:MAG: hypothetical protein LUI60_05825 [Clostridia bacterium]|nr:hypothetical protein [Clostridia bacterium]
MKKYFIYQLKRSAIPFGVMLFAALVIFILPLSVPSQWYTLESRIITAYTYLAIGLIAACILMPIWAFRYKMNKRSADLYYSLPIKRHKLFFIHYITGFISVIAAYTIVFLIGLAVVNIQQASYTASFSLINLLWVYLTSVAAAYAIYSVYSFAFTRANNYIDGIIFMIFATVALLVVALLLYICAIKKETIVYENSKGELATRYARTYYITPEYFMPFSPLYILSNHFSALAVGKKSYYFLPSDIDTANLIVSLCLYAALSVACTVGMFVLEKRYKAEDCEQNSDSIFGYKTMIPLIMFTMCAYLVNEGGVLVVAIALVAGYFLTAIWRRSLKIGWKAFLLYAVPSVLGIAAGGIIYLVI